MAKPKSIVTEYRNYNLPLHFPVQLLSGDYWKISDVPSGRLHFHNCMEIGICHTDSGRMECNGAIYPFRAGDVTVVPRNLPHTTYSSPGTESLWSYIFLDPRELFRGLLPVNWKNTELSVDFFRNYQYVFHQEDAPGLYQLACAAVRELEEQKPSYQYSARGLLLSLYIHLYRLEMERQVRKDTDSMGPQTAAENSLSIAPALEYIEDHYMQQFTIEDLAELCHWSPTHFRRVFHDIMGVSPLDYVNNTRIMKACNLLRSTDESILNISEAVGFRSISSFNRFFARVMMTSPREYRRQMQQSDQRNQSQSILEYAGWMYPE